MYIYQALEVVVQYAYILVYHVTTLGVWEWFWLFISCMCYVFVSANQPPNKDTQLNLEGMFCR